MENAQGKVILREVMAELEEAARRAAAGVRDPEAMRRACERMDRIREENRQRFGEAEIMADLEEVARQAALGDVRDTELLRRVSERAEKARRDVFDKFGIQDIGVSIIRKMRNAE